MRTQVGSRIRICENGSKPRGQQAQLGDVVIVAHFRAGVPHFYTGYGYWAVKSWILISP